MYVNSIFVEFSIPERENFLFIFLRIPPSIAAEAKQPNGGVGVLFCKFEWLVFMGLLYELNLWLKLGLLRFLGKLNINEFFGGWWATRMS